MARKLIRVELILAIKGENVVEEDVKADMEYFLDDAENNYEYIVFDAIVDQIDSKISSKESSEF